MSEIDLQEQGRRDETFEQLNDIVNRIGVMNVFPSLVWVWCWDVLRNIYEDLELPVEWEDEYIKEGVTLKTIFDKFWDDVDTLGINMDLGGEIIEETIRDWMIDNDFLVSLDDDGWLDD